MRPGSIPLLHRLIWGIADICAAPGVLPNFRFTMCLWCSSQLSIVKQGERPNECECKNVPKVSKSPPAWKCRVSRLRRNRKVWVSQAASFLILRKSAPDSKLCSRHWKPTADLQTPRGFCSPPQKQVLHILDTILCDWRGETTLRHGYVTRCALILFSSCLCCKNFAPHCELLCHPCPSQSPCLGRMEHHNLDGRHSCQTSEVRHTMKVFCRAACNFAATKNFFCSSPTRLKVCSNIVHEENLFRPQELRKEHIEELDDKPQQAPAAYLAISCHPSLRRTTPWNAKGRITS